MWGERASFWAKGENENDLPEKGPLLKLEGKTFHVNDINRAFIESKEGTSNHTGSHQTSLKSDTLFLAMVSSLSSNVHELQIESPSTNKRKYLWKHLRTRKCEVAFCLQQFLNSWLP